MSKENDIEESSQNASEVAALEPAKTGVDSDSAISKLVDEIRTVSKQLSEAEFELKLSAAALSGIAESLGKPTADSVQHLTAE
jgi:hypothetical protein